MEVQRQFVYKGFTVKLGVENLPPVISVGGGLSARQRDVAIMSWNSAKGSATRDISESVLECGDLDIWQKHAEEYIDELLNTAA